MYQPRPLHQPYKLIKITGECERSYFERRSIILINHEYIYLYQQKMICFSFSLKFKHHRYFLLSNGSLLITSLTINDTGRYKYVEVQAALTLFWLNFCLFFSAKKGVTPSTNTSPKRVNELRGSCWRWRSLPIRASSTLVSSHRCKNRICSYLHMTSYVCIALVIPRKWVIFLFFSFVLGVWRQSTSKKFTWKINKKKNGNGNRIVLSVTSWLQLF